MLYRVLSELWETANINYIQQKLTKKYSETRSKKTFGRALKDIHGTKRATLKTGG